MPNPSEGLQQEMWAGARPETPPPNSAPPGPEEERGEPRLKRVNRNQLLLRTVDVEQLVEADHAVRAIWELVGRLDLSRFQEPIAAVEGRAGRPAWDPHLLISLWVYAYSEGVSSAREVERRAAYHPAYQWLTGLQAVNHHTLSDFRVQHQAALDRLFADLLAALSAEGLISLEQVMHDGTKVKAAASGKSFRREETLREHPRRRRSRCSRWAIPKPKSARGRRRRGSEPGGKRWDVCSKPWKKCRRCRRCPRKRRKPLPGG